MEAQIIEGTFADIQRLLFALPFKADTRLRVIVTEPELSAESDDTLILKAHRRNGLILVPTKNGGNKVTLELVNELSED